MTPMRPFDETMIPMRALLLVHAECEAEIENALDSSADALVFDLTQLAATDAPLARKRALAALQRARQKAGPPLLYVRVNGLRSDLVDADLDAIMPGRPDGIVLPHSENGADIQHLSVKLAVREAEYGLRDGATKIIAMAAETPASLFHLGSYVGASRRLAGLIYGAAELARALGIEMHERPDGTPSAPLALARNLTLFAAKAADVMAIDAASPIGRDDAGLRRDCETARRDGFAGKLALHPSQVAIINAMFAKGAAAEA